MLAAGTTLGPYQILAPLGAGGMGMVYRARDTRLKRDIALKIIHTEVALDPDRIKRLEQEARAASALNHPNVCSVYDIGSHEGSPFVVMELLEGASLREKLRAGRIPAREAMNYAAQTARGLAAAHEKGIVHRDLKPENVFVTKDGRVKILDFGLAKLTQPGVSTAAESTTVSIADTDTGTILGTAAYMSPEQARGQSVDKRTDIWAFGCILYESLTGTRPLQGVTLADTIARILDGEPEWSLLPAETPPILRALLRRCLQKDRSRRQQDISDAGIEVEEALLSIGSKQDPETTRPRFPRWIIPLVFVAGTTGFVLGRLAVGNLKPIPRPRQVVRTVLSFPRGPRLTSLLSHSLAISPDGTELVYAADRQLYRRPLASLESSPIRGTEGFSWSVLDPFFSPDGEWIGFWADYKLFRIPLDGGTPLQICACPAGPPGRVIWGSDGFLLYTQSGQGILRVAATGGDPQILIPEDYSRGERLQWPQLLPGGEWVLFSSIRGPGYDWRQGQIAVQSLKTGQRQTLLETGAEPLLLATGHLTYCLDQRLMAVPFDHQRMKMTGEPVTAVDGIAQLSLSGNGTLAYLPASAGAALPRLVWVSPTGEVTEASPGRHSFGFLTLSRNGDKVALNIRGLQGNMEIWMFDLMGGSALFVSRTADATGIRYGLRTARGSYSLMHPRVLPARTCIGCLRKVERPGCS